MRYILLLLLLPYFYFTDPSAVMVNQLVAIRADRRDALSGGTIEVQLPPTITGVSAGLVNDAGPCTITHNDTVNVVCYPVGEAATLYVFGRAGPHTSPVRIDGRATDATRVIGDTTYLTLGGVVSYYFPIQVR